MGNMTELSIEKLRELFDYDPSTGVLTRRRWPGKSATSQLKSGYLRVGGSYRGKIYNFRAHRLIWALTHNRWPVAEIDHINGDRSDNRFVNLREATRAENAQNIGIDKPTRGTVFVPKYGKFQAQIYLKGKTIWLGYFTTREEAQARYLAAKATLHPFQPIPREAS